jgi:hypothetical protein
MSACIIPVAPNFQDPPSTPDSPPYLYNPQPNNFGEIVTVPVKNAKPFSANVRDPNVEDTLSYLWVVDYPPFITGVTLSGNQGSIYPLPNGQPIDMQLPQLITCPFLNTVVAPSDGKHQLELIVANRQFSPPDGLSPDNVLDSIDDPTGFVVRASWTFVISCPALTSSTSAAAGSQ